MTQSNSPLSRAGQRLMRGRGLRRRRRRALPPMSVLPTLCTLGNLVAGFAAIHFASRELSVYFFGREWTALTVAGALIFVGMFLDAIDGSVARLTRTSSELGGQLDSLADVITFGVAPAFMTLRLVQHQLSSEGWLIGPDATDNMFGKIIWGAAAVYVCCTALRLARYNVEMGNEAVNDHRLFRGLPSPGAAGTIVSLIILHQHLIFRFSDSASISQFAKWSTLGIPLVMLLCAFAMVSSIPYVHFANKYFRGQRSFAYMVRMVILLALLIWWFQVIFALGFLVYALSGPVRAVVHRRRFQAIAGETTASESPQQPPPH